MIRRRRSRHADDIEDIRERAELTTDSASPHDALEARELASQIEAAIDTLSIDRRVAVRLHLTGYDREDIARMFGWTEAQRLIDDRQLRGYAERTVETYVAVGARLARHFDWPA